ncbi:ribonuclease H-like domain-containing protein, partial [Tanacetum coccineum]
MSGSQDEIPPPPPPPSSSQTPTQPTPHTVLPPRTAEEFVAKERERKARTTLLMALPEDHLAKFHKMTDAKEMFQSLLSHLEIHGAGVSTEDANKKFLRSLPSAWSQVSLIMRTKPGVDSLSFDDLYNNLRVFENDVKGSTASSSNTQNVAFVSENTSSTNDVSTAYSVSNTSGQNSQRNGLEVTSGHDLNENEKTRHFARECKIKGNQDNKRRDAWNSGTKDESRTGKKEDSKALVTIDGEGIDWTSHSEEYKDYALMACNSSKSDTEREQLSDASIEIKAYTKGLKKVKAQLVAHQQGQLRYEQKIKFMKIDLDDKTDVLTYHKKLLAEAQKEKEDLKAKVEKWHNSSKNLGKLLNTQMSANDKFRLGFVTSGGMHVVPPPMTGNYMPFGPDIEVDYSQFTYDPKQTQPMSEPVVSEYNVECQPKVWSDAPIIEEYESNSEDEEWLKKAELNNGLNRNSGQREIRSIWNNVQRVNKQNQFVPTAVLTRTGKIPVNTARASGTKNVSTARHSFNRQTLLTSTAMKVNTDYPHRALKNKEIINSRCSRHMTRNKAYIAKFQDFNGVPVAFGGSKGYITGKGKIKTGKLDFEDVCFVKELKHFNFFSVSQMCDKKNKVLFTDSECLVLSPEFKLPDENHESNTRPPVRPNHTCVALFGPTSVRSLNHKTYCLVITDDFSRFSWVFFLRTKDETSGILKDFIRQIKNKLNQKVKTIRCDNGTEFKNKDVIEFCGSKGIKREYSNARTLQQNGFAERKNMTFIEAART